MVIKTTKKIKKTLEREKNSNIFPDIHEDYDNNEMEQHLDLALKNNIKNIGKRARYNELKLRKRREMYDD